MFWCDQSVAAQLLRKFCLVGRTENMTSFAWHLLALMGRNSSTAVTLSSTSSYHAEGKISQAETMWMERELTSPSVTDRWLYTGFSSSTGLPPDTLTKWHGVDDLLIGDITAPICVTKHEHDSKCDRHPMDVCNLTALGADED
jgi:hypothetical protein